jgi:hypothetical protein
MLARRSHVAVSRRPSQQPRGVQEPINEPGTFPKQRELLLQIDIYPAEEHRDFLGTGQRRLVQHQRQIHRSDRYVVARPQQFLRKCVVAHARSAIVAPGACR